MGVQNMQGILVKWCQGIYAQTKWYMRIPVFSSVSFTYSLYVGDITSRNTKA